MPEWFVAVAEVAIVVLHVMAGIFIVIGALLAFVKGVRALLTIVTDSERREVWLSFARALVAALTFQLAADLLESATDTSWDSIGRLGAVALIRTFLNYFLSKDLREEREFQRSAATSPGPPLP